MIRFKRLINDSVEKILREAPSNAKKNQTKLEDARELNEYFEKEVLKNNLNFLLWRGMRNTEIQHWEWFQMHGRNDRSHQYFKNTTKELVNQLENVHSENVPKRFHSAWCSPKKDKAKDFGKPYVCFLKKNANAVCWERDSVNYFHSTDSSLMKFAINLVKNEKVKEDDPKFYKFAWSIGNMYEYDFSDGMDVEWHGDRARYAAKMILYEKDYLKKMFRKYIEYSKKVNRMVKMIKDLNNYFKRMRRDITESCLDIMFDNGPYLLVEEEFFKEYFHWNGNEWKLKPDFKE